MVIISLQYFFSCFLYLRFLEFSQTFFWKQFNFFNNIPRNAMQLQPKKSIKLHSSCAFFRGAAGRLWRLHSGLVSVPPAESENKVIAADAWLTHGLSLKWSVTVAEDADQRLVLLSNWLIHGKISMVALSIVDSTHARETNLAKKKKKNSDKYVFVFSFCNLARNSEANKKTLEKIPW